MNICYTAIFTNKKMTKFSLVPGQTGQFEADLNKSFLYKLEDKKVPSPDVIIADPPRAGMNPKTVKDLLSLEPEKIVYVSCNPTTQARDIIITPAMLDKQIGVYNGKEYLKIDITPEMLGHRLGEFTYNRKAVAHSGPGIGATRGSKFTSLK